MENKNIQEDMKVHFNSKALMEQAKKYAYEYLDNVKDMEAYPCKEAIKNLDEFNECMPIEPTNPSEIIEKLHKYGSKATAVYNGGKYFGFVNGGVLPVTMAARWLSDVWDQNSALYLMSPIASKLEELCEKWIVDLLGLNKDTAAGFVSGSSVATISAITAARNHLLLKQGHDIHQKGLFGAPKIRVVLGQQAHSSIWKSLSILGIGREMVETVPTDAQGTMLVSKLPPLDSTTLVITQAGNVNGGAFDPLSQICELANEADTWVHVDGAIGLWAAASKNRKHLTKGLEKADSWSVDAHKTLNIPYDCGIVLCKNKDALVSAMQANGSYIQYSEHRDGMLFVPEMSRRARSIELWAALKYLGKSGVEYLVDSLCENATYFADELSKNEFIVANKVEFNQLIVKCENPEITNATLKNIQESGKFWCGGTVWENECCIRISVCSWQTTKEDIDDCIKTFIDCRKLAR